MLNNNNCNLIELSNVEMHNINGGSEFSIAIAYYAGKTAHIIWYGLGAISQQSTPAFF